MNITDRRMDKIRHRLDFYSKALDEHGEFYAAQLEHDLRKLLGIGWTSVKSIVMSIYEKHEEYRSVMLYFMRHVQGDLVPSEFKKYVGFPPYKES